MTEITISAKISKDLEKELQEYMKIEHLEKSSAIRKLLFNAIEEWRIEYALKLLGQGKTTISKAAQIAGMDIWSFAEKIKEAKIQWVKDEAIDDDLKEFR